MGRYATGAKLRSDGRLLCLPEILEAAAACNPSAGFTIYEAQFLRYVPPAAFKVLFGERGKGCGWADADGLGDRNAYKGSNQQAVQMRVCLITMIVPSNQPSNVAVEGCRCRGIQDSAGQCCQILMMLIQSDGRTYPG